MDGMYGGGYLPTAEEYSDKALMSPECYPIVPSEYQNYLMSDRAFPVFGYDDLLSAAASSTPPPHPLPQADDNSNSNYYGYNYNQGREDNNQEDGVSSLIKAKIASHPSYPRLVDAYIDCQKVGAPPEIACLLDEIRRDTGFSKQDAAVPTRFGADPELDEFMETYCDVLAKYKTDLEKPFDEASTFINKIEVQLRNLCTGASIRTPSDEGAVSSDEELSGGELDVNEAHPSSEDRHLKDRLLRRFGGHISMLKLEFSKKKKKGKLPKEARQTLLEWWNVHYKWPYPTEADKIALAESTGLDQKQINNWFINQRKRHWKPENAQFMNSTHSGPFYTQID